jgi:hypothetical protein
MILVAMAPMICAVVAPVLELRRVDASDMD